MKASLFYCVALCIPGIMAMIESQVPHSRPRISRRDAIEDVTDKCPDVADPCGRAFNSIRNFRDGDGGEDDFEDLADDLQYEDECRDAIRRCQLQYASSS